MYGDEVGDTDLKALSDERESPLSESHGGHRGRGRGDRRAPASRGRDDGLAVALRRLAGAALRGRTRHVRFGYLISRRSA